MSLRVYLFKVVSGIVLLCGQSVWATTWYTERDLVQSESASDVVSAERDISSSHQSAAARQVDVRSIADRQCHVHGRARGRHSRRTHPQQSGGELQL